MAIDCSIPGYVEIRVKIEYLRRMFSADGENIIVRLVNCTKFTMKIWEDNVVTDDPKRIVDSGTEILSTDSDDVPVHVVTTQGEIDVDFEDFGLSLDNGRSITFEELCNECENYWNRWGTVLNQADGKEI